MGIIQIVVMIVVFQLLFSVLLRYPMLGLVLYGGFILYSYWKMKKLGRQRQQWRTTQSANTSYSQPHQPKSNGNIIDVEYTEKEIKD